MSSYPSLTVLSLRLPCFRSPKQSLTLPKESVEDEDEVLTALSDELGGFVEYVGGPEYAHVLLSPLENLAAIEELLVRDKVSLPDCAPPRRTY
jgi:serine/threonine-protein phosphatase 2A regulatory subunit A